MPSASAKIERIACSEAADPVKQFTIVLEKKVRNLEKRKLKLDNYKNDVKNGKELNDDQKIAVSKYDQVVEVLEFSKDLCKSLSTITSESLRLQKKLAKKEQIERQQHEIQRLQEALYYKHILFSLENEEVRNDFLNGENGAVKLYENDLTHLDQFSKLVGPNLPNDQADIEGHFHGLAENLIFLVEGRNKEIAGTTYKSLKEILQGMKECGYFSRTSETTDVSSDDAPELDDPEPEKEIPSENGFPEDVYAPVQEIHIEPEIMPEPKPAEVQENSSACAAENLNKDNCNTFAAQNGCLPEVLSTQGSFNFLQDSQIELDTPHMDPAVIAVHQIAPQMNFAPSYPIPQSGKELQEENQLGTIDPPGSPTPIQQQQMPIMAPGAPRSMSVLTSVHSNAPDYNPNHPIPTQTFTNQNFAVMQNMMMSSAAYVPVTMHHGPLPHHMTNMTPIAVVPGLSPPAVSTAASVMPMHVPVAPIPTTTSPVVPIADAVNDQILNEDVEHPMLRESVSGPETASNNLEKTNDPEDFTNNYQRGYRGRGRGRGQVNGYYRGRGNYNNRGGYQGHNNYYSGGGSYRRGNNNSRGRMNNNIRSGRGTNYRSPPTSQQQQ